jgi:hypothetical protein
MPLVNLPQFTEVETKIVGPLTFKQFLIVLFCVLIASLLYIRLPRPLSLFLAVAIVGSGFVFSFLKVEGVPFYTVFLGWLRSLISPRVIYWGKGKVKYSPLKEIEIKKFEKEKIGIKREGALRNLITKVETKK